MQFPKETKHVQSYLTSLLSFSLYLPHSVLSSFPKNMQTIIINWKTNRFQSNWTNRRALSDKYFSLRNTQLKWWKKILGVLMTVGHCWLQLSLRATKHQRSHIEKQHYGEIFNQSLQLTMRSKSTGNQASWVPVLRFFLLKMNENFFSLLDFAIEVFVSGLNELNWLQWKIPQSILNFL